MNERICGEYALLTGLSPCDGLLYVNGQISAHSKSLKALVEVYKQHPGQRDLIEGFIDNAITQISILKKIKDIINQSNSTTMEAEKMNDNEYYSKLIQDYDEEQYLINKCEVADAFEALHNMNIYDGEREMIAHCLSLLNDHLERRQREFLAAGGKSILGLQ